MIHCDLILGTISTKAGVSLKHTHALIDPISEATIDGIFPAILDPMPLMYFKFVDATQFLQDSLDQLIFILHSKMPLIDYIVRLQSALLILERIYFTGALGFNADPWFKRFVNKNLLINLALFQDIE
jgi:hypothetical protein